MSYMTTRTPPNAPKRAIAGVNDHLPPAPLSLALPSPLALALGAGELLSTPFEVLVVVGKAFKPPPPYGHPTKFVSGWMKHVSPAEVPFTNVVIFGILPVLELSEDGGEGSVKVTFVREVISCKRGVGGLGVR
jgi:hypothetical protein